MNIIAPKTTLWKMSRIIPEKVLNKCVIPSEYQEQCAFVEWFRWQYPQLSGRLFAIPNGELRDKRVAQKLKKQGVLPGVADLFLMVSACGYHGLFIEMKRVKGGQQSEQQKIFESECKCAGYLYALCKGQSEAQNAVRKYMSGDITTI